MPPFASARNSRLYSVYRREPVALALANLGPASARRLDRLARIEECPSVIVDGYVRVSQVSGRGGDRFISPAVQREQIEGWAKLNGALVAEVFEELDESGSRSDRPLFLRSIDRVEAGQTDGVVVAKLDRFARSLVDALHAIQRIQLAGGTFVSVQDGLDLSTDTGKLVVRIMLSIAEWELDRIRTTWNVARQRAIARGLYLGPAPPGYKKLDGHLIVDPITGPFIADAFRRRARRASIRQIGLFLESHGVVTGRGNPGWAESTTSGMLRNRAYLGEARSGEYVNRAAHPPLIDASTWYRAQTPNDLPQRRGAVPGLLRGLLRCASCRRCMCSVLVQYPDGRSHRHYYCRASFAGGVCPDPARISARLIEPYVEAVFWQELRRRPSTGGRKELSDLRDRAAKAEAALTAYRDNPNIIDAIGAERFAAGLAVRRRHLEKAMLAVAAHEERIDRKGLAASAVRQRWETMDVPARRLALGEVIESVFVSRGTHRTRERTAVCLRGEAPLQLPARGLSCDIRAFDPRECRGRSPVKLDENEPLWPTRRILRELGQFVGDTDCFPSCEDFQVAGKLRLLRQVQLQGGPRSWARVLGIRQLPRDSGMWGWSDRRVRDEIDDFLTSRETWPTVAEFKRAGHAQARVAIAQLGGADRWAREFGLTLPRSARGCRPYWTESRIDTTLADFLIGRTRWPGDLEFRAAGLYGLLCAIRRRGGVRHWARRVGFVRDGRRHNLRRARAYQRPARLPADPRPWVRSSTGRADKIWTTDRIVDAIRLWTDETGTTPRARAWESAETRFTASLPAAAFPSASAVIFAFGSWRAALEAAGYDCGRRGLSPRVSVPPSAPVPRFPPSPRRAGRGRSATALRQPRPDSG